MKFPGIMSGKVFKGTNPEGKGVQTGPNLSKKLEDPAQEMIRKIGGVLHYEANGAVAIDPDKIEYLKS